MPPAFSAGIDDEASQFGMPPAGLKPMSLKTKRAQRSSATWDNNFQLLAKFKEQEGHCDVPKKHSVDGVKLGVWVTVQRDKRSKLSDERVAKLDELGFRWSLFDARATWNNNLELLAKFREQEGHCDVPRKHSVDGVQLGHWVAWQRNRRSSLSKERKAKLDQLGFRWSLFDATWSNNLELLAKFKEQEGHCDVPTKHSVDGVQLGHWVACQRNRRSSLSKERVAKLDELGFRWNARVQKFTDQHKEELWSCLVGLVKERKGSKVFLGQKAVDRIYLMLSFVGDRDADKVKSWIANFASRNKDELLKDSDVTVEIDTSLFTMDFSETLLAAGGCGAEGHEGMSQLTDDGITVDSNITFLSAAAARGLKRPASSALEEFTEEDADGAEEFAVGRMAEV